MQEPSILSLFKQEVITDWVSILTQSRSSQDKDQTNLLLAGPTSLVQLSLLSGMHPTIEDPQSSLTTSQSGRQTMWLTMKHWLTVTAESLLLLPAHHARFQFRSLELRLSIYHGELASTSRYLQPTCTEVPQSQFQSTELSFSPFQTHPKTSSRTTLLSQELQFHLLGPMA